MEIFAFIREEAAAAERKAAEARGITVEELREERAAKQAEADRVYREEQAAKAREKQAEWEAYGRNAGLNIPARPAVSVALAGLYESRGDGQTRRSVTHVQVLDSLDNGRIHRSKHQFLCRKDTGSFGAGDTDITSKVTCPKCSGILDRINAKVDWRARLEGREENAERQERGMRVSR